MQALTMRQILRDSLHGKKLACDEAMALSAAAGDELQALLETAADIRNHRKGRRQPIEPEEEPEAQEAFSELAMIPARTPRGALKTIKTFGYGIARGKLEESAQRLRVPLTVVNDLDEADLVVTVKNYYRKRPKMISDAEKGGMPIYVLRSSTAMQIDSFITDVFGLTSVRRHWAVRRPFSR